MSRRTVAISPADILNTRVGEVGSRNGVPNTMMLASHPRTYDTVSEPVRRAFATGHGDNEQSQYLFTAFPSATTTSTRNASQAFPTNTVVHLAPVQTRNLPETQGQEEVVKYEITQNGLKFKGNVKGVKITATQVASKVGHPGNEEETHQAPQCPGSQDVVFINQSGARFLQSVIDSETEVSQSVGGMDSHIITQDAVEVDGDAVGGSFINNQRVW